MVRALVGGAVAFVEVDDGLLSSEACGVRGRTRESRLARTRFVRSEDCNSCNKIVPDNFKLDKTRFENEVRSYCKSRTKLKVVKWG